MFGNSVTIEFDTMHRVDVAAMRPIAKELKARFRAIPVPRDLNYMNVTVTFAEHSWLASATKAKQFRVALASQTATRRASSNA